MKNSLSEIINDDESVFRRIAKDKLRKDGKIKTTAYKDARGELSVDRSGNRSDYVVMKHENKLNSNAKINNYVGCAKISVKTIRDHEMIVLYNKTHGNVYHSIIQKSVVNIFLSDIDSYNLAVNSKFISKDIVE